MTQDSPNEHLGPKACELLSTEYQSLRDELSSRWTMLYALGTLAWVVVAGGLAAIYATPGGPHNELALFLLPVLIFIALLFGGEIVWMSGLHRTCQLIEHRLKCALPEDDQKRVEGLLWHHRYGRYVKDFPGSTTMLFGVGALLALSVTALSVPVLAYFGVTPPRADTWGTGLGWAFVIVFALGATVAMVGTFLLARRVQRQPQVLKR